MATIKTISTPTIKTNSYKPVNYPYNVISDTYKAEQEKNNGGLLGGVGYLLEKTALGLTSGLEGIVDFTAGGFAKMFGADDWAERVMANDWVNYEHADEWYDPGEGWKFAGDVFGGVGTSIPAIGGAIAGGAETFFGKNKGRTIDAVLKKVTAVVAILFIVTSIVLAIVVK